MAENLDRGVSPRTAAQPALLHYRPWTGSFRSSWAGIWPIARVALGLMLRRWLFWALYGLGLLVFLLFFFGQYLAAYAETVNTSGWLGLVNLRQAIYRGLRFLDGSGNTYRTFFNYQGYIVMVVLALAGSVLIGNDLRYGSLPFYLSKPLSSWHYLLGKGLAVAVLINLLTTVPALLLFVEYASLYPWSELGDKIQLLPGILGYGAVLTVSLSLLLLASALWLQKTVPLIMMWTTLFVFCRLLALALVQRLRLDARWYLLDLWNDTYLVGNRCLGMAADPFQPAWYEAALVLGGVSLTCLIYLILRLRAVEIVR